MHHPTKIIRVARAVELILDRVELIGAGMEFILLANVKEHATLSAGASVDHGVKVETTKNHVNRAADRGCCVSACSV